MRIVVLGDSITFTPPTTADLHSPCSIPVAENCMSPTAATVQPESADMRKITGRQVKARPEHSLAQDQIV